MVVFLLDSIFCVSLSVVEQNQCHKPLFCRFVLRSREAACHDGEISDIVA